MVVHFPQHVTLTPGQNRLLNLLETFYCIVRGPEPNDPISKLTYTEIDNEEFKTIIYH